MWRCQPLLQRCSVAAWMGAATSSHAHSSSSMRFQRRCFFDGQQQTDFYRVLGVSQDASQDEIKAAYKKLALEFHPDRNKAANAEEKFKTISEAYSVIGNKTKRRDYDAARVYGNPGRASSQGTHGGQSSSTSSSYAHHGPGYGQQYTQGNPFQQYGGGGATGRQGQNVRYEQMSKEEADKLFRDLFGGMQVDQIFREFEKKVGNSPRGHPFSGPERMQEYPSGTAAFRPFFREDTNKVFTDAYGNRTEERTFTTANGTRYTVRNTSSKQEGAGINQTPDEFYQGAAGSRASQDGRASFGTSSFRVNPRNSNNDFGQQFFGIRTHGRHPLVGAAIIVAWSIILCTIAFGIINVAVTHPIFLLALITLYYARRMRF